MLQKNSLILRTVAGWRLFTEPVCIIQTDDSSEVCRAFEEVERELGRGRYVAGFVAYEAAAGIDPAQKVGSHESLTPLIWFGVYDKYQEISQLPTEDGADFYLHSCDFTQDSQTYTHNIRRIREYLQSGEIYQANYTYKRCYDFTGSPLAFFKALYAVQPTEYAACINTGQWAVCSVSPELFFHKEGNRVIVKPMKGTRSLENIPPKKVVELTAQLASAQKDRAENVMIVDMIRNDLGRIARTGSVEVPVLFEIERHSTVLQMTSTVTARTDYSAVDVFKNLFPCASITGAPKVASMKVIAELEPEPRGVYTGAIGCFEPDGAARFNVAIRTAVLDKKNDRLEYGVGGGIIWDSQAVDEYAESLSKAAVLGRVRQEFSLFETIHWNGRRFVFLREHLCRLEQSASFFAIPYNEKSAFSALEKIQKEFHGVARRVKLLLSMDGVFAVESADFIKGRRRKWRLQLATTAVQSCNPFLRHKTTRREVYENLKSKIDGDTDDVLLYNQLGHITETSITNILYKLAGRWFTPPLSDGLLAGTARAALLRRGHLSERSLHRNELAEIEDLLLLNSLRGLIRAVII